MLNKLLAANTATAQDLIDALVQNEVAYNGFKRSTAWDHCRKAFVSAHIKQASGKTLSNTDFDDLAKSLTIYLANWGMYRGSSFLILLDYKFHVDAVKMMLEPQYADLFQDSNPFGWQNYKVLLFHPQTGIYVRLNKYYHIAQKNVRVQQKQKGLRQSNYAGTQASDTLITKILLGVYGCIPAYDTYAKKGLALLGGQQTLNDSGSAIFHNKKGLCAFFAANKPLAKELDAYLSTHSGYTFMKLADMFLFQLGILETTMSNTTIDNWLKAKKYK